MKRFMWAALLGSAAVLVAADAAQAQISFGFGRGGGWGRGGDSWYVGTPYGSYGQGYYGRGYSPYGGGWYGPGYGSGRYGYGSGWGSRYGYPYSGFGVSVGSPSYYPSYGYSYPGYSSSFPTSGYSMSSMSYPVQQAGYRTSGSSEMQISGMSTQNRALVQVMLPNPDAELWFEDSSTLQKGFHRVFISPELEADKKYTYHVKARWMENGREVTREKQIDVRAGKQTAFAFGEREDEGRSGVRSVEYTERDPGRAGTERRDAEIRTETRDRELDRDRPGRSSDDLNRTPDQDRSRQPERPQDRNVPPTAAPGNNNNPPPPE